MPLDLLVLIGAASSGRSGESCPGNGVPPSIARRIAAYFGAVRFIPRPR